MRNFLRKWHGEKNMINYQRPKSRKHSLEICVEIVTRTLSVEEIAVESAVASRALIVEISWTVAVDDVTSV